MSRRRAVTLTTAFLAAAAAAVAVHTGTTHSVACPAAADGHGSMSACAPVNPLQLAPGPLTAPAGITYPDRSNNDPTLNMAAIKRAGHPAIYLKVNQGTGYVDQTFLPMVKAARAAGIAVGGYDFVSSYTVAEANTFIARLHAAGMTSSNQAGWMPPTLDVEYGGGTRAGVQAMVNAVRAAFGRVNVYTGAWYWAPHFGCWWPTGTVTGWLAGYPTASVLCGLPAELYTQHQYTDAGFDGVSNVDMNQWLGTSGAFRSFARLGLTPAQQAAVRALAVYRAKVLALLRTRHCWTTANYHSSKCHTWRQHAATAAARIHSITTQ